MDRTRILRKRWLALIALALLVAIGAFTVLRMLATVHALNPATGIAEVIAAAQNQSDQPGTLAYRVHHGERVNILMLGYGGAGHDGAYLTDSILVLSIQGPDRVTLTSVPRDTYVSVPAFVNGGTYSGKINAAYEIPLSQGGFGKVLPAYDTGFDGAGKLASKVVGDFLGITIDYFVGVDFTAFKTVVNAIGGIDVVNPNALDDWQYPQGESGGYTHIHFDAGPLHLNGDQALIYVRERHADSDFGRSRRQQQVIAAIKDKAVRAGAIPNVFTILDAVKDNVRTNMTPNDLTVFTSMANQLNSASTHHVSLDNSNWQWDTTTAAAGYILLMRDHTSTYLKQFIQAEMVDPAVLSEKVSIEVSSTPAQASRGQALSTIWTSLLGMLNFQTAPPLTGQLAPPSTVVHDYSGGRGAQTVAWLASYFRGTVVTETPAAGMPDVVLTLGSDFAGGFDAPAVPAGAFGADLVPAAASATARNTPLPPVSTAPAVAPRPAPSVQTPAPLPTPAVKPTPTPSHPAGSPPVTPSPAISP